MQAHVIKIKACLDDYRQDKFTGGIKMAFEKGIPKTLWESSNPDFDIKPLKEDFSLDKALTMATAGSFSGSLLFILEDGVITRFDHTKTLQGRDLLEKLDNYHIDERSPAKRPALVVRKKA